MDDGDDSHGGATHALVRELHDFEKLLRTLYAAGGRLTTAAAEAQASERVSPIAGHKVLTSFSSAHLAVTAALGHVAEGHRHLEAIARKLGYDVDAFGDETKPPRNPLRLTGSDALHAVV